MTTKISQPDSSLFSEATPAESTRPRRKNASAAGLLKDRYLLEEELGRGAIGVAYLARDQQLHSRPVVIKVLQKQAEDEAWFRKKFRQEIEALSRINHPGIVGILDAGETQDGKLFLVMQFINGSDLSSFIPKEGAPLERVAGIMRQIGQALTAAHEQGICHRDLKPANIMLEKTGPDSEQVKLIDFGIAAVRDSEVTTNWETATIAGSLAYMAPEQLKGQHSAASDIYALGVIAYEMVTGRLPFLPHSSVHLYQMQQQGVRLKPMDLRPDLPEAAQAVILQALSFDPAARPAPAREFGDQLARALTDNKPPPEPPQPPTLEIAHVLFMDLVGYSTLTIDRQASLLQQLQEIVKSTPEFQRAQAANRLIRLPTGDGMALVFFQDPIAPVQCALNIARALKSRPDIKLRMGVHSGPVSHIADINANKNIAGGGINVAQRVMDCGDAGHILLSQNVAEVLSQLSDWAGRLRDLGEHTVKHGARVRLFNLCAGELGNPAVPAKLRSAAPSPKRLWLIAVAALLVAGIAIALAWFSLNGNLASAERVLNYSLVVQRNPKNPDNRNKQPFTLPGEMLFARGDRVQLNITNLQAGYLYVLNEGPMGQNKWPYNLLFPAPWINGGTAQTVANQMLRLPEPTDNLIGYELDNDEGQEKLWVIWSAQSVPELEAAKQWVRKTGEIQDASQTEALREFLTKHPPAQPVKGARQTTVKGNGDVLVALIKLEHH